MLGAVLSGQVCKHVGGYNNRWPLIFAFIAGLIAVAAAVMMPWVDDPVYSIMFVWIVLFTGAFILPIMTGVMLLQIETKYKSHANSLANMSYNLLGYLPAPTIYGWANGSNIKSRAGMTLILYMSIPSVTLIGITIMIRKFKKSRGDFDTTIEPDQ